MSSEQDHGTPESASRIHKYFPGVCTIVKLHLIKQNQNLNTQQSTNGL